MLVENLKVGNINIGEFNEIAELSFGLSKELMINLVLMNIEFEYSGNKLLLNASDKKIENIINSLQLYHED